MIWNISPIYFSDEDLIEEYNKLNEVLLKNNAKYDFYLNNEGQLHYRIYSVLAELNFRKIKHSPSNIHVKISELNSLKYQNSPYEQLSILGKKYNYEKLGRAPIPKNAQELWAHHKYSVMARNINLYKEVGRTLANDKSDEKFEELALTLCNELIKKPKEGSTLNALQHMWGYISDISDIKKTEINNLSLINLLYEISDCARKSNQKYLISQTALSELAIWIEK